MKKQLILTTAIVILIVVTIGVSVYIRNKLKEPKLDIEKFLTSKPHEHIGSDGTVVQHKHTYEDADLPEKSVEPLQASDSSHPIQRAWERLDLEDIRQKYQPHTVAEMQEIWESSYSLRFGSNYPYELDEAYPPGEWLQRNLELGQHFANPGDYSSALQRRIYMIKHRDDWKFGDEEARDQMREYLDLPPDVDTWEEYEDAFLKTLITSYHIFHEATASDPSIAGGTVRTDGTFIPFKANTVHVHINPERGFSTFTGVKLTYTKLTRFVARGLRASQC